MEADTNPSGYIFNIKRFAVHDGPGIRTSVFLKGCPLSCIWCHNPEGISPAVTLWYNRNTCILCGKCIASCGEGVLSSGYFRGRQIVEIDRDLCTLCGDCVKECPTGSLDFTGREIRLDELMSEIRKDTLYYGISGGGVTLTGGEPLAQGEFCLAILKACRNEGINTAIETSLYCEREVLERVVDFTCHFIADMKISDRILHERYTGKPNDIIMENLRFLAAMGKSVKVRVPLISGITDSSGNKKEILNFIKGTGSGIQIEYLEYNRLTPVKYEKMGVPFSLDAD